MYCAECGCQLSDSETKCPSCGSQVIKPPVQKEQQQYRQEGSGRQSITTPQANTPVPYYVPYPVQQQYIPYIVQQPGMNGCCVAGFVLSFIVPFLGFIFSVIGISQTEENKQRGKGLAIAGLIISIIDFLVVWLPILIAFIVALGNL